jgi:hypothetical protein
VCAGGWASVSFQVISEDVSEAGGDPDPVDLQNLAKAAAAATGPLQLPLPPRLPLPPLELMPKIVTAATATMSDSARHARYRPDAGLLGGLTG